MKTLFTLVSLALLASWVAPANAHVYMALELEAEIIHATAQDFFRIYFHYEDYRTEPGVTTFTATLKFDGNVVRTLTLDIFVPSDFKVDRELTFPMPGNLPVPAGTYELCLLAEREPARETACAEVTLDGMGKVVGFSKKTETLPKPKEKGYETFRTE
ncbi:MAG: hypothetical protein ABIJ00_10780 [Candidatus Eisenbacteria bacterium]